MNFYGFTWTIPGWWAFRLRRKPGGMSVSVSVADAGFWWREWCWPGFELMKPYYRGGDWWCEWRQP